MERTRNFLESINSGSLEENVIRLGIDLLYKADVTRVFHLPVPVSSFPNYLDIVSKPLSIQDMKMKMLKSGYKTFEELNDDVYLMVENCYAYNGRGKYSEVSV